MAVDDRVRGGVLAVAAVVLAAVNLRPAVTSVGPVLAEMRSGLGMSASVAGLLTSVPAVCFAVVGITAPRLALRFGAAAVIAAGTAVTVVGLAGRTLAGGTALFLALSALALAGIAVVNVMLPAVVKRYFPDRVGPMTGLYSMALNVGATTAAAVTVPVTHAAGGNWRVGLGVWAVVALVSVPPWVALVRRGDDSTPSVDAAASAGPPPSVIRSGTAWALAGYFGLQATAAYVIIGWLPQIFRDAGLSAGTAGLLFAVTSVLGVPLSLVLPTLAGRMRSQSALAAGLAGFGLLGYAGLWAAPAAAPWLWAVLLGLLNCSFPLALTMIGMRGRDSATVARLSAFAQSVGYLISVPGPVVVGAMYERTGSWRPPLVFLFVLMLAQTVVGALAGRNRRI